MTILFPQNDDAHRIQHSPSDAVNSLDSTNPKGCPDGLILALAAMIGSVNVQDQTAQIQCKQIEANAQVQQSEINQAANYKLIVFTRGMEYQNYQTRVRHSAMVTDANGGCMNKVWYTVHQGQKTNNVSYERIIESNELNDAMRNGISNQILLLRQIGQNEECLLNSTIDQIQQTIQEGASAMQMLTSVASQICRR